MWQATEPFGSNLMRNLVQDMEATQAEAAIPRFPDQAGKSGTHHMVTHTLACIVWCEVSGPDLVRQPRGARAASKHMVHVPPLPLRLVTWFS